MEYDNGWIHLYKAQEQCNTCYPCSISRTGTIITPIRIYDPDIFPAEWLRYIVMVEWGPDE